MGNLAVDTGDILDYKSSYFKKLALVGVINLRYHLNDRGVPSPHKTFYLLEEKK